MKRAGLFLMGWCGAIALGLALPRPAAAAWPLNPLVNVPVCTAAGDQSGAVGVADGAGGMIVAWYDFRSGSAAVYAQRVSAAGVVQWPVDGVLLCSAAGVQVLPRIVSDGANGAIVVWEDNRSGNTDL